MSADKAAHSVAKLVTFGSTLFAAVATGGWAYMDRVIPTRLSESAQQERVTKFGQDGVDRQAKILLEIKKLNARLSLLEELIVENSAHLVGHALHPKKKLSEPVGLIRAVQRVRQER